MATRIGYGRSDEIVAVDCFPLHLPLLKALPTASHTTTIAEVVYLRIRTRGGAEGWGEAGVDPAMSGETLAGMVAAVERHVRPRLIGRPLGERIMAMRALQRSVYGNGGPKAAADMALLDVAGTTFGVPAVELLGGARRRSARVLRMVGGGGDGDTDIADVTTLHNAGFRAFKLKVGVAPVEQEAATVARLRALLGPDTLIGVDANMGWGLPQARRFGQLVAPHGLDFLEQPTLAGDTARLAAVARATDVPVGADEALHGLHDIFALAAAGAIAGVSLKAVKFGGVGPLVHAAGVADALGLSVNVSMLAESGLATAAMVHAACAVPQVDWGLALGALLLEDTPVDGGSDCVDGTALCPSGPGLGVRVQEQRLQHFAAG